MKVLKYFFLIIIIQSIIYSIIYILFYYLFNISLNTTFKVIMWFLLGSFLIDFYKISYKNNR